MLKALPFILLLFAACDTLEPFPGVAVSGVSLNSDGPQDDVLSTIGLVLRNGSAETIEAEACASLERRIDDSWTTVGLDDRPCDLEAVVLEAGESRVEQSDIEGIPKGVYRFVQETSIGTVASSSFRNSRTP